VCVCRAVFGAMFVWCSLNAVPPSGRSVRHGMLYEQNSAKLAMSVIKVCGLCDTVYHPSHSVTEVERGSGSRRQYVVRFDADASFVQDGRNFYSRALMEECSSHM
jgi:hypothetical protein